MQPALKIFLVLDAFLLVAGVAVGVLVSPPAGVLVYAVGSVAGLAVWLPRLRERPPGSGG